MITVHRQKKMKSDSIRQTLWKNEYDHLRGINLGYGNDIPYAVSLYRGILLRDKISNSPHVLDIGCGKGRIGMHLAEMGCRITGIDFIRSALQEFSRIAKERNKEQNITLIRQDINLPWNVPDRSVDAVFAVTVLDNLVNTDQQVHVKNEILRVLKQSGMVVVEWYTSQDGYYGYLLGNSPQKDRGILCDPNNKIAFKIYTKQEVMSLFGASFEMLAEKDASFESVKYGQTYKRHSHILALRRKHQ